MKMNFSRKAVLLLVTILLSLSYSHLKAWQTNGVPICTAVNYQQYPMIVSDGYGGAIITWQDKRNGNYDIYAQRMNSSGSTLWSLNGVAICTVINDQVGPEMVSDGAGGAIIIWESGVYGGTYNLYAQRVSSSGKTLWTLNEVTICNNGSASHPEIVSDGSGGAIITWQDERYGYYNINAQKVTSQGSTLWTLNGKPICSALSISPTMVSDGLGGAIITWMDYRNETNYDIYAQRVNSTGSTLWTINGVPICTAANNKNWPTIVSDGSSGAIITWTNNDIYAQRVNSTGSTLWTNNGVAICTVTNSQWVPTISSDGSGGAIITWQDNRNGSTNNIYAQRVGSSGSTLWTLNGVAICTGVTNQLYPLIVSNGLGGAIITWQDFRNDTTGLKKGNIYIQQIDSTGNAIWTLNGVAVCTVANDTANDNYPFYLMSLMSNVTGRAIITWEDYRNGTDYDIYAQQVTGNGLVPVVDWMCYANFPVYKPE